jgi:hypothetical protein
MVCFFPLRQSFTKTWPTLKKVNATVLKRKCLFIGKSGMHVVLASNNLYKPNGDQVVSASNIPLRGRQRSVRTHQVARHVQPDCVEVHRAEEYLTDQCVANGSCRFIRNYCRTSSLSLTFDSLFRIFSFIEISMYIVISISYGLHLVLHFMVMFDVISCLLTSDLSPHLFILLSNTFVA